MFITAMLFPHQKIASQ